MLQIFSVNIVTLKSRTVFNDHGHTASAAFLHGACSEGGERKISTRQQNKTWINVYFNWLIQVLFRCLVDILTDKHDAILNMAKNV